jgi:hypothetical protein
MNIFTERQNELVVFDTYKFGGHMNKMVRCLVVSCILINKIINQNTTNYQTTNYFIQTASKCKKCDKNAHSQPFDKILLKWCNIGQHFAHGEHTQF